MLYVVALDSGKFKINYKNYGNIILYVICR